MNIAALTAAFKLVGEHWRVALAVALMALCFLAGWTVQGWRHEAAAKQQADGKVEAIQENVQQANTAAAGHERDKVRVRQEFVVITETVERVVEKPLYRNVCFDDDGLRELRRAIATTASESGGAVPTAPVAE